MTNYVDWGLANCLDVDPEIFHSVKSTEREWAAARFCHRCPIRVGCRDDALTWKPERLKALVAGGWSWDARGKATPSPLDTHMIKVAARV